MKYLLTLLFVISSPLMATERVHYRGNSSPGQLADSGPNVYDLTLAGLVSNPSSPAAPEGDRWLGGWGAANLGRLIFPLAARPHNAGFSIEFNIREVDGLGGNASIDVYSIDTQNAGDPSSERYLYVYTDTAGMHIEYSDASQNDVNLTFNTDVQDGATHAVVITGSGSGISATVDGASQAGISGAAPDFGAGTQIIDNSIGDEFSGNGGGLVYLDDVIVTDGAADTPTLTQTKTTTPTPTFTATPTWSPTRTATPTASPTGTFTATLTFTTSPTPTKTGTPTSTRSNTPVYSATLTSTNSPTPTWTPTATQTHTPTLTRTPTSTRTVSPTQTNTPTVTLTPTAGASISQNFTAAGDGTPLTLSSSLTHFSASMTGTGCTDAVFKAELQIKSGSGDWTTVLYLDNWNPGNGRLKSTRQGYTADYVRLKVTKLIKRSCTNVVGLIQASQ